MLESTHQETAATVELRRLQEEMEDTQPEVAVLAEAALQLVLLAELVEMVVSLL